MPTLILSLVFSFYNTSNINTLARPNFLPAINPVIQFCRETTLKDKWDFSQGKEVNISWCLDHWLLLETWKEDFEVYASAN